MAMFVNVIPYNSQWAEKFEMEKTALIQLLGEEMIECFHIGSTAIPDLMAKPIIDILLVAKSVEGLDSYAKQFELLDYEVMKEFGISGRRYYRKGGDNRTHHIHAFSYGNTMEILRHLAFRDYLCCHFDDKKAYGELKAKLAKDFPQDIESYGDGKEALVKAIEAKALQWYWKNYKQK